MRHFRVVIGNIIYGAWAYTPGGAARKVFREQINLGRLKNQPLSDEEGGWKGVSITCES